MAQRRRKRQAPDPGGEADEGSEETEYKSAAEKSGTKRAGEAVRVGGI